MLPELSHSSPVNPVHLGGAPIAKGFWKMAWCTHLAALIKAVILLAKGPNLVRNNAILDLELKKNIESAKVLSQERYKVKLEFVPLFQQELNKILEGSSGQIHSPTELLYGNFSSKLRDGLFNSSYPILPQEEDIVSSCTYGRNIDFCPRVATIYAIANHIFQLKRACSR
jgi:uncharacterized Zn finger protein